LPDRKSKSVDVVHIDHAISAQALTSMYLMHKYWVRKPHNVVGDYIEHYSKKGEIVLDPFIGSGVTAVEEFNKSDYSICLTKSPTFTAEGLGSSIVSFVSGIFSVVTISLVMYSAKTLSGL